MEYPGDLPSSGRIPVDYKITKPPTALGGGDLAVHDARGELAYRVDGRCSTSSGLRVKKLLDAAGAPLITIVRHDGEWQAFKGNGWDSKDLLFTAKNVSASAFRAELNVFLSSEFDDHNPSFGLKGNPFRRSCTIIRGDSIVAQTNLMYKLRKLIYSRRRFLLTVYPGNNHVLVIAMLVAFYGMKS